FAGLARVAQGMEELLGDALDSGMPLPAASVSLLRRSQGRLARLIESVRTGADNSAIVADDDADRSASRGSPFATSSVAIFDTSPLPMDPAAASGLHSGPANGTNGSGEMPAVQLPDWLSAFAGQEAESFGASSQPGAAPSGQGGPNPANGMGVPGPDQWAHGHVSDMPTSALPATGEPPSPASSTTPPAPFQQNEPWAASGPTRPFNPALGGSEIHGASSQPS